MSAGTELRPCPFCGGHAKRFTIGEDDPVNVGGDVIACERCGACSHVEFGRKENLVSIWNGRVEASHHAELVRGLRAASEALSPAHMYPGSREDWEEHQRETGDWIDALLAKHTGEAA